jgi:hypothetical protein
MAENIPRTDDDHGTPPRMPRWVRVAVIIVGLLVLLFVVLQLTGIGGEHGPRRHVSGPSTPAVATPPLEDAPAAAVRE